MRNAANGGFINATDLADYLTKKGVPFRTAYRITGTIVAHCIDKGCALDKLTIDEYKTFSSMFEEDLYDEINLDTCVEKRTSEGATSYASVMNQIELVNNSLNNL